VLKTKAQNENSPFFAEKKKPISKYNFLKKQNMFLCSAVHLKYA
jgi:hypothetical protein